MWRIFVVVMLFFSDPLSALLFNNGFESKTSIKALGRSPQPGDLYERGRNLILPDSLFKQPLPMDKIRNTDAPYTHFNVRGWGMTFTEMANSMELSMGEKLSVALGITKPTGSSSFLTAALGRSRNPTGTACITTRTVTHGFSLWDKDISNLVSLEVLEKTNATDLIISVRYGLQTCYNRPPESNSRDAGQSVTEDRRTNFTLSPSLAARSSNLVCRPDMMGNEPLTLSEEEVNRKRSKLDSTSNFGEPIEFELLPLSEGRKLLNVQEKPEIPFHAVPGHLSERIIETAEKLHKINNELSEFWNRTLCQPIILPESKLSWIQAFEFFWYRNIMQGMSKMADAVTAYRNGTANERTLITAHGNFSRLLSEYESSYRSNEPKISVKPADLAEYKKLADSVTLDGVQPITNADAMNELMRSSKTFVVLKYKLDWIFENPEEWKQLRSIFLGYHGMWSWFGNPDKYLVDCDLLPEHCKGDYSMTVDRYEAGHLGGTGDYLCAISASFRDLRRRHPYGAFRASWVIEEPFKSPYKPCRTRRVLTKYQGVFWDHDLEIVL